MGSPKRGASPLSIRGDSAKVSERRKDDERELDRDSGAGAGGRSHFGKDSYRHSDRYSSRSSNGYSTRHDEERLRKSRVSGYSDHARDDNERGRSRDYLRNADTYSRDKYGSSGYRSKDKEREVFSVDRQKVRDKDASPDRDKDRDQSRRDRDGRDEKRDYHRSSGDYKSALHNEESKGFRNEPSGRENEGRRYSYSYKDDLKERKRHNGWDSDNDKDRYNRAQQEQIGDKPIAGNDNQGSLPKRPKLFSSNPDPDHSKDANVRQKQVQEVDGKVTADQVHGHDSEAVNDLNAAKVAAMKAAELVNKNLAGVSIMSTEQKKKLLWGNKKSATTEVSAHRWDIGDHERQGKFNKLMGVKGDLKVEHKSNVEDDDGLLQAEKQKEVQLDLEKQYTAGLRRRDGRTVGLGL